jgi:ABC-2 type transport system ATP-binding protein
MNTESEILVEARSLTRRYGPTVAVSGVDLTLRRGEVLGLLGPNGAGKSTTMKMLTGNLAPSEGEVLISGRSLRDDPKAAKQSLGYLPEQPPVYPELTVDEYLRYCAGLHGIARRDRDAAVASAKRDCGLGEVAQRLIGNLSKGYQQRVGLAQAIIHRPPVIVLDEPTVGLDPIQIREIRTLIAELARNHSVILSSHILPEIQAVCSRVVIVHRGRTVYDQPVEATASARFGRVVCGFRAGPDAAALGRIPGVTAARNLGEGRWALDCAPGADPRDAIAETAAAQHWKLFELHAETRTLEDIFVELTAGDDARLAA